MDKRKQIEEMTNIMFEYAVDGLLPEIKNHMEEVSTKQAIKKVLWEYAKALYEAGCRKISKNAVVVLTKERDGYLDDRFAVCHKLRQAIAENAELQKQVDELKSENTELYKEHTALIAGSILEKRDIVKDTAKEILQGLEERKERVKSFYGTTESVGVDIAIRTIKEICKQKGVEVE